MAASPLPARTAPPGTAPTAHPSVCRCRSATSSSASVTCAARSSTAVSWRVSARSAAPISTIRPSARSRGDPHRRGIPPGEHQAATGRHMIGQHRQRGPALGVMQHVHVIQDQRHRHGHRRKRRRQPGDNRAGHRAPRRGQSSEYPLADRLHLVEGLGDVGQQDLRVVVRLFHRHPGEGLAVGLGPLRQQRRLPVPGRRHHRHDRVPIGPRQPLDQQRTPYRPGPHQRMAQLRHEQVECRPVRTAPSADSFTNFDVEDPPSSAFSPDLLPS